MKGGRRQWRTSCVFLWRIASLMSTLPRVSLVPAPGDTLCFAVKLHRDAAERDMCLNPPWWYQLIVLLVVLLRAQLRYQADELRSSSPRIHNPTSRRYLVRVGRYNRRRLD